MSTNELRVVLIGDDGVGKSSILSAFLTGESIEINKQEMEIYQEISIPPEVTPSEIPMTLIDTSCKLEHKEQLEIDLKRANVVLIVYSVVDQKSLTNVFDLWIPLLRELNLNVPVILLGNKIDKRSNFNDQEFQDQLKSRMKPFKEIVYSIECSAKQFINIDEAFYFAHSAVLYPIGPIYDTELKCLTPLAIQAFERIFSICDLDNDDKLNDDQVQYFQSRCFLNPLQNHELQALKRDIEQRYPKGLTDNCINLQGFLHQQVVFIQEKRAETVWVALESFGYDFDLGLKQDLLYPPIIFKKLQENPDLCVELNSKGIDFFTEKFKLYMNENSTLSQHDLENLFKIVPSGVPFDLKDCSTLENSLTVFLNQMRLIAFIDPKQICYILFLFGFRNQIYALKFIKKNSKERKVYLVNIFGARGSGKTTILKNFIDKQLDSTYEPTFDLKVINTIKDNETSSTNSNGKNDETYLILRECQFADLECDLACFVYDPNDLNSFEFILNLRKVADFSKIGNFFISLKKDHSINGPSYEDQAFIRKELGLDPNICLMDFSIKVFKILLEACRNSKKFKPKSKSQNGLTLILLTTSTVVLSALIFYKLYKLNK